MADVCALSVNPSCNRSLVHAVKTPRGGPELRNDYRQIKESFMFTTSSRIVLAGTVGALLAACSGGGGSSGGSSTSAPSATAQTTPVAMLVSDASTQDWATIGVKILSISLVPQGGGANVTVYTAPTPTPVVNLVELDQIAELLGNVSVPVGTYTAAVLTVSANPGDVLLTTSINPEPGFAAPAQTTIPGNQIEIQHTQGAAPSLTVPISVSFVSPLVATAAASNALDLEFDLGHPAFIVDHVPPAADGGTIWAVNFDAPLRHHPLYDISRLVLRHMYGDVTAVDTTSITITKEFPTEPAANPETAISSSQSLQILADSTNGTLFYDVDANTRSVITSFSADSSLAGKQVRIAARYQQDGTLVATRIWASANFANVWLSPEGHVLHVNAASNVVTIENESGIGVSMVVNADTQFFFRQPQDAVADATPIGTGTAFLASENLVRGFKVHASVVDPLATPLVAQSIDIETAVYSGTISAATTSNFVDTNTYGIASDDYTVTLDYLASATANGTDPAGNPITGFQWWNFAYPTLTDSGTGAIPDFVATTAGTVNFGGTVGVVPSTGSSYAVWNTPANAGGWAVADTILTPTNLPLGFVVSGLVNISGGNNSFSMIALGGTTPATIDVSSASGEATLVYQVDRTAGIVTVSSIDIATPDGLAAFTANLLTGVPVKVYGIPQSNDALKAYVLVFYTGVLPIS
jgi:hypothetical protein